jgi:translocation and assembly module TamA
MSRSSLIRVFLMVLTTTLTISLTPPVAAQAGTKTAPSLEPDSPLAPMTDIGVEWPDLTASPDTTAPSPASPNTAIAGEEHRYSVDLSGLPMVDAQDIRQRFDLLSTLKAGGKKTANVAQIERRAREDAELLNSLLRAEGYYDANVDTAVAAVGDGLRVTLTAEPGPIYKFSDIKVNGLDSAEAVKLRGAFGVETGDVVDADRVNAGEAKLKAEIGLNGFPFAKVGTSDVLVDHETQTATLALNVETGGAQRIGTIIVANRNAPFDARHVQRIARFKAGDVYSDATQEDLRRAIIATGLASSVKLEAVPGATPQTADIKATIEPAPVHTIAGEIGYGTGEGARVEVSWTHRNLIHPEGAVTLHGLLGTQEQQVGVALRQNNFGKRDQVLNARLAFSNLDRLAFAARTFEIGVGIERQSNIIWQKKWTWSIGTEVLTSDERDTKGGLARRRNFIIAALPATLGYDGSDDLLNPTRGFRLSGRISPELSFQSGTFGYARVQLDGSAYLPVTPKVVLAGRARLGTIIGAPRDAIAPSRRFYSGGGGSVRGFDYQGLGPRDAFNDPTGGRSLAEFSIEARIRLGNFGIVPFLDAGKVDDKAFPDLKGYRFGAGLGVRYYTSFGPIRVDVGTPLGRQANDPKVGIYVSLGQAF